MKFRPHGDLALSGSGVCVVDLLLSVDPGAAGLMPELDDGVVWNLMTFGGLDRAGGLHIACPRKRQVCWVSS